MSKRFLIRWLLISLGLHLVAAVFSTGYQNSDEHFQILEFLNTFLGGTPASSLPIEYGHLIRPWFQPFLYWVPVKLLMSIGIQNPFTWAFAARLLSSMIGWLSVVSLAVCVPLWIQNVRWQRLTVIALSIFWCLPALHARTSSENLSGALFIIGLCWAIRIIHRTRKAPALEWAWVGVIWGLAFEARYQVGFMVAGGFFWLALVARKIASQNGARLPLFKLAILFSGILAAIGLGSYLDYLGYGQWTFAPWNYFHFNLIQDYVSSTDVSPWWDYFRRSWTESWPLLGFLTLMSMILFWIRDPWHPLTWSHAPLFLVHVAIGHKETRFLFPLVNSAPICLMLLILTPVRGKPMSEWIFEKASLRWLSGGLVFLNGIALVSLSVVPASPTIRFYKAVYNRSIHELWYLPGENPYTVLGIPLYFYRAPELELTPLQGSAPHHAFWLASRSANLSTDSAPGVITPDLIKSCEAVSHALPAIPALSRLRNWTLFECKPSR